MIAVTFRTPTEADIDHVAAHIRGIDALECKLVGECAPRDGIARSIDNATFARTALVNGVPQCIFGVGPSDGSLMAEEGRVWMLGATSMCAHARALLIHSKPVVAAMQAQYERLTNIVHADNGPSIRWLKWLGFSFKDAIDVKGHAFLPFEKARIG